jgi:outer membrane protein assembly factor BamB
METVMRRIERLVVFAAVMAIGGVIAWAQGPGRTNSNWPTIGADAQRTSWMKNEVKLSAGAMTGFQFLWKARLDAQAAPAIAVSQPLLLQNIISHKGFKALAFVAAGADVYAIDYDLNRVYWKQRLSTAAKPSAAAAACGGKTAITRAASVAPPGPPGGRGGAPGPSGRGPAQGINPNNLPINSAVYAVSSGGMLHFLNPHIGEDIQPPVKFLSPNAKVSGLIAIDNVLYAATSDNCGGVPNGVWALDLGEVRTISKWESASGNVVGTAGPTFGLDGWLYVATQKAIVRLEPKSLRPGGSFAAQTPLTTAPVAFRVKDREFLAAANSDGRVYLLDAKALAGGTPAARSPEYAAAVEPSSAALATWEEPDGTRWIVAPARTGVVAFKLVAEGGNVALQQGWTSREIPSPTPPTILNDIVLAAAGRPAVLYALDGRTGQELWNSGTAMSSSTRVAPAAGDSQVYVVTDDGTLYAFGLPQER